RSGGRRCGGSNQAPVALVSGDSGRFDARVGQSFSLIFMPPVKSLGERIADALVQDGLLSTAQVEELMEKQKKDGTRFIKLVVEKAYVTEIDLVVSMGRVLNTPPINVTRAGIPPEVADLVPRDMASNYKVLPISR